MPPGRDGVRADLLGKVVLHRCDGTNAPAQLAVLLERDKRTCSGREQLSRQVGLLVWRDATTLAHVGLERETSQRDVGILRCLATGQVCPVEGLVLLEKRAALICALLAHRRKCSNPVAHAKGSLVGEKLRPDGCAVKRARHYLEAAQTALGCALGKAAVHSEQGQQIAGREGLRDLLVKLRAFWRKAVRAARQQLVREVARGHVDHAPAKLTGHALYQHAHTVVVCWREARDAHAHHLEVLGVALDEVERNHGAVVEGWIPLALAAG